MAVAFPENFRPLRRVDVVALRIEVYREPRDGAFSSKRIFERGEAIQLLLFPAVNVLVSDVLV